MTTHPYLTNRQGKTLVEQIAELRKLQDHWYDEAASKAVTKQSCDLAEHVLPLLFHGRSDHKPYIYPTLIGGLEVEVDRKGYGYCIEFLPDGASMEIDCFYDVPGKQDLHLELSGLTKDDFVVVLDDWIEFL